MLFIDRKKIISLLNETIKRYKYGNSLIEIKGEVENETTNQRCKMVSSYSYSIRFLVIIIVIVCVAFPSI